MENVKNVVNDKKYRSELIDALYEIRTSLAIKRIISKTILASKFKNMLDTVKKNYDDKVKIAIDNIFQEFFAYEKKDVSQVNNGYSDNSLGKDGSSLVMIKKGFKSDPNKPDDN